MAGPEDRPQGNFIHSSNCNSPLRTGYPSLKFSTGPADFLQ